jgi:hypothetical protein
MSKKYLFFWGHDKAKCGVKACFSNWYADSPFVDGEGRRFGACVLAWFALLFSLIARGAQRTRNST